MSTINPLDRILSKRPPLYQTNHLPDRELCGVVDYAGRVCAERNGHTGAHIFVPRTRSSNDIIAAAQHGEIVALTGPGSLLEALTREAN